MQMREIAFITGCVAITLFTITWFGGPTSHYFEERIVLRQLGADFSYSGEHVSIARDLSLSDTNKLVQVVNSKGGASSLSVDAPAETDDIRAKELFRIDRLESVVLFGTGVTDAAVISAKDLLAINDLDLTGTSVSDASIEVLIGMKSLRSIYLSNTLVTVEGINLLRKARPDMAVCFIVSSKVEP